MDRQDVFNRVYKHALGMTAPAVRPEDDYNCMYRSPTGPCLIGSLITDEVYSHNLEGMPVSDSIVHKALADSGIDISKNDENFLNGLQMAHDGFSHHWPGGKESMLKSLRDISNDYSLEVPK